MKNGFSIFPTPAKNFDILPIRPVLLVRPVKKFRMVSKNFAIFVNLSDFLNVSIFLRNPARTDVVKKLNSGGIKVV